MKAKRATWTQDHLTCAIKAVKSGSMTVYKAAIVYQIPKQTLHRYIEKNVTEKQKLGRQFALSNEQQKELNSRITRLADIGYPITTKILRLIVYKYCQEKKLTHQFSDDKKIASFEWARRYLRLNCTISIRKAQNLNPARAQKLNKIVVSEHFRRFKDVQIQYSLNGKPSSLYNLDEKGCRLAMHKSQPVLAAKGARRVHSVGNEHGQNVTIVACVNAAGTSIPPMILFKGKRQRKEWTDDLPAGSVLKMTDKGSMTQSVFKEWLKHFAKHKSPGRCILVIDGAKCHLSYEIVELAETLDIILYCLPSNTTHELQPLDKAVFRSFEQNWDDEVSNYFFNNEDRVITKQRFGKIFTAVWDRSLTPKNIKSGFKATGLYPYNPNVIPEEAFAPSEATFQRMAPDNSQLISHALSSSNQRSTDTHQEHQNSPRAGPSTEDADLIHQDKSETEKSEPRSELKFRDLLPSPTRKNLRPLNRRQSINSHAIELTKDLFEKEKTIQDTEEKKKTKKRSHKMTDSDVPAAKKKCAKVNKTKVLLRNEEWFCKLCLEDWIKDMRMCVNCHAFVHEDCAGLTKDDTKDFICRDCESTNSSL